MKAQKVDKTANNTPQNTVTKTQPKNDDNTWNCMHCTFENKSENESCEMCGLPNQIEKIQPNPVDTQQLLDDGWRCKNCQFVNIAKCELCEMYGSPWPRAIGGLGNGFQREIQWKSIE
eukprot:5772_1